MGYLEITVKDKTKIIKGRKSMYVKLLDFKPKELTKIKSLMKEMPVCYFNKSNNNYELPTGDFNIFLEKFCNYDMEFIGKLTKNITNILDQEEEINNNKSVNKNEFNTIHIPWRWNPDPEPSSSIIEFMAQISGGDANKIQFLYEVAGYCLLKRNLYRKFFIFQGPGGTGKSTLSETIMGNPRYHVTQGDILLNNESIVEMPVDERARKGLFLAMQYPAEVPGVTNAEFLRAAINARRPKDDPISVMTFLNELDKNLDLLDMNEAMTERYLNEGFSGGEKKRNEILQMLMIKPSFGILDEIDSGLDIDALRVVSRGVNAMRGDNFGALMITHYQRLLDYIVPDIVHVMMDGRVVKDGGPDLAKKLEQEGYAGLRDELGLDIKLVDEN